MRNPLPVIFAGLMPHAPVLVPSVGADRLTRVQATVDAMRRLSRRAVATRPELLVVLSPHSPQSHRAFGIWRTDPLHGSFELFGSDRDTVRLPLDHSAADRLEQAAAVRLLRTWRINHGRLDHGATVPLHYLAEAGWAGPTLVVGLNDVPASIFAALGEAIAEMAAALHRRVAVIASGDMSHRLAIDAPCGYHPAGSQFDERFIELLKSGNTEELLRLDPGLCDMAAEDVIPATRVALAAVDYNPAGRRVLSYEGPFGVGYGVAVLFDAEATEAGAAVQAAGEPWTIHDPAELPQVARRSVAAHFDGRPDEPPRAVGDTLAQPHGLFVTLHTGDELRGCRGSPQPNGPNLAWSTWFHARQAAFDDGRFMPLEPGELPHVRFSVSVLGALERVTRPDQLDPARYGILVTARDGQRRGLLLPAVPTIEGVAEQILVAKEKAGIAPAEQVSIERFTTCVYEEAALMAGGREHGH